LLTWPQPLAILKWFGLFSILHCYLAVKSHRSLAVRHGSGTSRSRAIFSAAVLASEPATIFLHGRLCRPEQRNGTEPGQAFSQVCKRYCQQAIRYMSRMLKHLACSGLTVTVAVLVLKLATADAKQAATSLSALYACCTIVCCVILHVPVCKLLIL